MMHLKTILFHMAIYLFLSQFSYAYVLNVPADYSTIQNGINAAASGDTVLVAPGVYHESIQIESKEITLGSHFILTGDEEFIGKTIISGGADSVVVSIIGCKDTTAVLSGVTINNIEDEYDIFEKRLGIVCNGSNSTIEHVVVKNFWLFGVILRNDSDPVISKCAVDSCGTKNHLCFLPGNGGIVCSSDSNPFIVGCTMTGNWNFVIVCGDSSTVIKDTEINDTYGTSVYGIICGGNTLVKDVIIKNLYGSDYARCIYASNTSILSGVKIFDGYCGAGFGKAIVSKNAIIYNCLISGFGNDYSTHAAIDCECYSPTIVNVTIDHIGESIYNQSAGIRCESKGCPVIINTTISNCGYGIFSTHRAVFIKHSNFWSNCQGDFVKYIKARNRYVNIEINKYDYLINNTSVDPMFASNSEYRLSANSPLIDAGIWDNAPEKDIRGMTRVDMPDIGAYEYIEVSVEDVKDVVPEKTKLYSCSPNPFNPVTSIRFSLSENQHISLFISNITGQKVRTIETAKLTAGFHEYQWNGRNDDGLAMSSGVYIVSLTAGNNILSQKIVLIK